MSGHSLSLVVAVYNEEELLEEFVKKSIRDLSAVSDDFEIILVDDGSTDRSKEIERQLVRQYSQVKVISFERNRGIGVVYAVGFKAAQKEIIFNNTVDAFFDTADLPKLLPHLDKHDAISCYRTDLKAHNWYQRILTLGNYFLIRALFPVKLRAYQTVQFYRRDFYQTVNIEAKNTFLAPELLMKAIALGLTIVEVPIVYYPRKKGKAKGGKLKFVWRTFRDIIKFWFRWVILRQPLVIVGDKKYYIKSYKSQFLNPNP